MKQRPRIYYTESQKALMWERCGNRHLDLLASQAKCCGQEIESAPKENTKLRNTC
jgi:hypothetical protein